MTKIRYVVQWEMFPEAWTDLRDLPELDKAQACLDRESDEIPGNYRIVQRTTTDEIVEGSWVSSFDDA